MVRWTFGRPGSWYINNYYGVFGGGHTSSDTLLATLPRPSSTATQHRMPAGLKRGSADVTAAAPPEREFRAPAYMLVDSLSASRGQLVRTCAVSGG